jgi:large subunit ribosomal protein L20
MKALVYSYVGRKRRKQDFKKLWVCRVNAAARQEGITYSSLKNSLRNSSITFNLKMLAQLAVLDQQAFSCVVKEAKSN